MRMAILYRCKCTKYFKTSYDLCYFFDLFYFYNQLAVRVLRIKSKYVNYWIWECFGGGKLKVSF